MWAHLHVSSCRCVHTLHIYTDGWVADTVCVHLGVNLWVTLCTAMQG